MIASFEHWESKGGSGDALVQQRRHLPDLERRQNASSFTKSETTIFHCLLVFLYLYTGKTAGMNYSSLDEIVNSILGLFLFGILYGGKVGGWGRSDLKIVQIQNSCISWV